MKIQSIILLGCFLMITQQYISSYNQKKHRGLKKNVKKLSKKKVHKNKKETPKGYELQNHFGANPFSNPYGPRPQLVNREAYIKNADGTVVRKRIRLIIGAGSNVQNGCDITQKDYFYYCMNLNDCDLCSASPYCGWCEMAQQCLPGNIKETSCPGQCINGWVFNDQSCNGKVKSGSLSNIDPMGTEQISTVEYALPKYKVDSVITTPEVVTTPVLLGTVTEQHILQKKNVETGQLIQDRKVSINKPIYAEIRQVMPVNTHQLQYVDAKTGKRLDRFGDLTNIGFHGTDNYIIQPETNKDFIPNPRFRFNKKKKI